MLLNEANEQKETLIGKNNNCQNGPAYWCANSANAKQCNVCIIHLTNNAMYLHYANPSSLKHLTNNAMYLHYANPSSLKHLLIYYSLDGGLLQQERSAYCVLNSVHSAREERLLCSELCALSKRGAPTVF